MKMLRGLEPGCPRRPGVRRVGPRSSPLLAIVGVFALTCGTTPVGLSPVITLSSSRLSFTANEGGTDPPLQTVSITSGGGGTLTGLAVGPISYGAGQLTGWLVASLSGSAAPATITLSDTTTSLVPGTYTAVVELTSSVASNSPQAVDVTLVMGPPSCALCRLAFTVQPSATVAGAVITPAVQVTAKDASGNTATGFTGPVTVATLGATDTIFGTTSVAAVKGVATFANLRIDRAGAADTLTATASGFTGAESVPFSVTAGPVSATQSAVFAVPDSILTSPGISTITILAHDAFANPIRGAVVALSATGAGNNLAQPAGPTDVSGVATGTLASTVAETKIVSATINGTAITQTVTVTVRAVSATRSTVSAAPTSFAAICSSSSITVTARDAGGAPIGGAPVTLAVTGTGNTLTQPTGQTDASGVATGTLSSTINETKTVSAAINGTPITQAVTVTVTPGPPTQLCFTVQPRTTAVGRVITPAVQVTATDASGHVASGFTGPITVAIGTNPAGGTLSGTTSAASVNGVATFTNLSINKAGTGYTLTAAAGGFTGATSAPFNIFPFCGRACRD
jgi:Big-like domain-containing protein